METVFMVALGAGSALSATLMGLFGYVLISHFRYTRSFGMRSSYAGAELLAYWWREVVAMILIGAWTLLALGRNALRGPDGGRPVLCVHGYVGNGTNWWGLRGRLHAAGRPSAAVDLGRPLRPLEAYVPPLVEALVELSGRSPDGRVDVVAHSMGGLILRIATRDHPDVGGAVGRVVTLGSPHEGTDSPPAFVPHEGVQMRRGSEFLDELPAPPVEALEDWTTIAAEQDYVVFPEETSSLEGTSHAVIPRTGHAGLLVHGFVHDVVLKALLR
jgi:pimeloyl-ACP methyl ester carboxylesterase